MNYYFITGSSSGIGKALVKELLKYPNNYVFGLSRTNSLTDKQFEHHTMDLSNPEEVEKFKFSHLSHANKIVLINNAGTLGEIAHVGKQTNRNITDSIMVNFTAAAVLMNKFIQAFQEEEIEKIIVNLSSGAASNPYDGWANYCSAKAALNMYTQVIREEQEMKKYPIQSFAIAPGVVDTLMQDEIREAEESAFSHIQKFKDLKANDNLYTAHDVAVKMISMITNPSTIPSTISRIKL